MATNAARAQAILEALLNGPSTAAQRQRLVAAYGADLPAGSTAEQIAGAFVQSVRADILAKVRDHEAGAAFDAARNAAFSKTLTDFPQAP
jgi:3-methyladenine DNA glycosylase/8-oxoguanine DNA glycosylase